MKRILLPGIVAGLTMLAVSMIFSWVLSALAPHLTGEYANTALFRPWSDPLMSLFLLYPFVLGIGLAWVWDRLKGVLPGPTAVMRGLALTRSFWLVSSIPGILMSYASFPDELAADEYAGKHQLKFFRNSARPDLLIMPTKDGQPFSEPDADRFEQWWNDKLQGFWRSFKPLFLKTAVEVKVLEQNFRNLQLTELRKHERDTIIQAWGLPPEMFGIIASSNRSTIDMAPYIFAKYCLVVRIDKFRSFFQRVLETEYENRLILDYISPVPSDKTFALEAIKAQPKAFQLNEVRVLAEMEPLDELEDEFAESSAPWTWCATMPTSRAACAVRILAEAIASSALPPRSTTPAADSAASTAAATSAAARASSCWIA